MLLHWCTLEPAGASHLAAIRFSAAVHVRSIRIFPSNAKPFSSSPDIIARTEPDAFFLDVYFNAQPTGHNGTKHKATNAMVPTSIAYTGGQMEFAVDMGLEYATRFMVLKGNFKSVSLAIYGDIISELPAAQPSGMSLPSIEPSPLSRALDPSNSPDPTALAEQLLTLISDAPPLALLIRLMFCLKPSNEDWDNPGFPYLYADIGEPVDNFDLDAAFILTSRPVSDDVEYDSISRFAGNVATLVGDKSDNQSYVVAGILCHAASQHPDMARCLLDRLDLEQIFDAFHFDDLALLRLVGAASNADVARHLHTPWFTDMIETIINNPTTGPNTRSAAHKLMTRVRGWPILEDALSNTQADFSGAAGLLRDIGADEQSFGVWLTTVITHQDLITKLAENSVMPFPLPHPPLLLQQSVASVSHDDFIAFLRAYIGVACILAVFAWADSLGSMQCRERALAIIRLWQGMNGYREILNHLLLLKQMIFRLDCNLDNDPPTHSGIDSEHILVNLAQRPQSVLSPDLIKCVLSMRQPLSFITEEERMALHRLAVVGDDGLPAAMEVLARPLDPTLTLTDLRTLRVAMACMERELNVGREDEWRTLQALWDEGSHGLILRLVDIFVAVTSDIKTHFALRPPPQMGQDILVQLFEADHDILRLIVRLVPSYPMPSRSVRVFVSSVADLFVCTDAADMLYSQSNPACVAAQSTRQICIDSVRTLAEPTPHIQVGVSSAEIVFRTLLEHGLNSGDTDPAYHLSQVFSLIDHLLPFSTSSEDDSEMTWLRAIIPSVLTQLKSFFRALDTENKVHLVKRLANLDHGTIGIGEYLVLEELEYLSVTLQSIDQIASTGSSRLFSLHQVSSSLKFISDLVATSSNASAWCIPYVLTMPEASSILTACLESMLDKHLWTKSLIDTARTLAAHLTPPIEPHQGVVIAETLLRDQDMSSKNQELVLDLCWNILQYIPGESAEALDLERLRVYFVSWLEALVGHVHKKPHDGLSPNSAELVINIMDWIVQHNPTDQPTVVLNLSQDSFTKASDHIRACAPESGLSVFEALQPRLTISGGTTPISISSIPEHLELTLHEVEDLLVAREEIPSTPPQRPIAHGQDVFGLVTVSPPTALLRSPAVTGLNKTYVNNDFRQLRQTPLARQNTSRLPSMHVDEFELNASSPTLVPLATALSPVPTPVDSLQTLSPAFNTQ